MTGKGTGGIALNGRSHLSIGEVLSLLQDEFPEVTISKIRFLESQGLVDPERTPSGYRKFYEADIERLRWVLRQQRDAFLPLKVIKGRLDQQGEDTSDEDQYGLGSTGPARGYDETGLAEGPLAATTYDEGLGSIGAGASGAASNANVIGTTVAATSAGGAHFTGAKNSGAKNSGDAVSGDRVIEDRGIRDRVSGDRGGDEDRPAAVVGQLFDTGPPYPENGEPDEASQALGRRSVEGPYTHESVVPALAGVPPTTAHSGAAGGANHRQPAVDSQREEPDGPDEPDGQGSSHRRSPTPVRDRPERGGAERGNRTARPEAKRDVRDVMTVPDDEELALDDLVQEGGVDIETVRDLERYGLITPRVIGGASYYTRDATVIIQLASAFARHGVEARHLRAYKGAADREAGLVQQVIMPLIRQRNPEARQAAIQTVEELSRLGGELRAALLRSALAELR
ncbi:MAG TPA: MerR family transcriptional regulator [Acidimicrobiales bacterium]|nr:MerR family transcriptional regulator [Acidimicrobiales bacterium]